MYQAKEQGRNTYRFYSREANEKSLQRMLMLTQLRRAVEREEFKLLYQPQVNVSSGSVTGLEALVRWQSEVRLEQTLQSAQAKGSPVGGEDVG